MQGVSAHAQSVQLDPAGSNVVLNAVTWMQGTLLGNVATALAALLAAELARHVAFFSIGTNDLTQYVMAADRLNPRVADLNRADHPAVLRAVELICAAAREAGIWVGVCGEAAARPDLIATFLGFGVSELSMSPASISRAKAAVMQAD